MHSPPVSGYFLVEQVLSEGVTVALRGGEAGHLLKSRRVRPGERIAVQDSAGNRFAAEVTAVARAEATVRVGAALPLPPLPPRQVTLLQAAVKDKAAEFIVQKATELGVARIVFFPSFHGTVAHKALSAPRTLARWERIAWEACKQSGRRFPPALAVAGDLAAALETARRGGAGWVLEPGGGPPALPGADGVNGTAPLAILVGPEGGFTPEEAALAHEAGLAPVGLGGNVLRAETAALAACALALLLP